MELKYIWIKKYKNLENIGFNFDDEGNEYFEYKDENLIIKQVENNLPNNFFSNNIKGITAIVGENGSGKTNFSEFLNYNLAHIRGGLSTYIHSKGIIVLDKFIFFEENIKIRNETELKELGYKISPFKHAPLDKPGDIDWAEMEKNSYVYYSPVFDFRILPMGSGFNNIVNISTSYLANNDVYNSSKHKLGDDSFYRKEEKTDLLYAYYRNEKLRESDIILNYKGLNKFIKQLPSVIKISIDHESENQLLESKYYLKDGKDEATSKRKKNLSELNSFNIGFDHYSLKKYLIGKNPVNGFEKYSIPIKIKNEGFQRLFLITFFKLYIYLNKISFPEDFLRKFIFELDYELKDVPQLKKLKLLKKNVIEVMKLVEWKQETIEIHDDSLLYSNQQDLDIYNLYRNIEIRIKTIENKKKIINLISTTKSLLKNQLHFHYQFSHKLSSGEQNLLNFYSRFYWAKNEIINRDNNRFRQVKVERIIIFIDEGDVALHPEWQRRFFNRSVEFLSDLFNDWEIQLVYTTHSPFVLSDIPKENIIFLRKNKETGKAEIANMDREKTFGANIYSLLSDSFFMEKGTIGEFAKEKIEWVLKILDNKEGEIEGEILKKINYIIDAIGEPLIKMQLESMKTKRINSTEVSELQEKVKDLKDQLDKRNNDQDQ